MDEIIYKLKEQYRPPLDGGYIYIEAGNVTDTIVPSKLLDLSSNIIKEFDSNELNSLYLFGNNFSVITTETHKIMNTLYIIIQLSDKQRRYSHPNQSISYIQAKDGSIVQETLNQEETTKYDGPYVSNILLEISGKSKQDIRQFKFSINNVHKTLFTKLNYHISAELLHKTLNHYINNTDTPDNLSTDENYLSIYNNYKTSLDNAVVMLENQMGVLFMSFMVISGLTATFKERNDDDSVSFTINDQNAPININLFKKLMKDEYIVTDETSNVSYTGNSDVTMTDENTITMRLKDFPFADVAVGSPFKIKMKSVDYYKGQYSDNEDTINDITKELGSAIDDYNGMLKTKDTVEASFKYIDMYKYVMYLVVIAILIVLFLGNEDIKPIFSMVMLGIIVAIYVIFLSTYTSKEMFSEDVPITSANIDTYLDNQNIRIQETTTAINHLVTIYEPLVAVSDMYERILEVMQKDIRRLDLENNIATNRYHMSKSQINQEWHDGYTSIAIVSALVIVSVILLGYYFLATTIPQSQIYVGVMAVIGIVITLFYYFYKVSQNVRTRYNGFYWNK